ncbi:MAG: CbtA family protein [Nitrososphaeraceae archaeon]|nr:CbtA family protein [Nitrososphaeraceae archaeon]MDW0156513.1 CbtA family protein [Nitrososphaeraceae archaeon]
MKALTLVGITLSSGVIAGIILAFLNLGIVEPTIDKAIALEVQKQVSSGENVNMSELIDYRYWQKAGAFAGGAIYGAGLASLFGVVFVFARSKLPGKNNKQKAILLAGIMWFVLFLMVALKYPANPPAVGDPETIYYRETLYVGYIMISGLAALGMAVIWIRTRMNSKKIIIPLMYAAIMVTAYVVMPSNPDKIEISMDLIQTFRILTAITIGVFWGILGIIFGSLWDKFLSREQTLAAKLY